MNMHNNTSGATPAVTAGLSFCTGWGQYDTRKDTLESYKAITGKDIAKLVKDPSSLPKDQAQWLIPSTYMASDARCHEAQRDRGEFWFLALDVDTNNLTMDAVQKALDAVCRSCCWMIYASRSATEDNKKWRALVPLQQPLSGEDYTDTASAFYDLLEDETKGELIPDRALERCGQLIYLPNRGEFYDWKAVAGNRLFLDDQHPITRRRWKIRADRAKIEAEAKRRREQRKIKAQANPNGNESIIEAFNASNTVADMLDRCGYVMGRNGRDHRSPNSSTGSYAVRNFGEFWFSFSGSDDAANIGQRYSGGRIGDAFDLFVYYDHGGDFKAAVRAYAIETSKDYQSTKDKAENTTMADLGNLLPEGKKVSAHGQGQDKPKPKFELIRSDRLEYCDPEYLIEGLMETETFGLIFGDPACGKSFAALDIACCVATGAPFHGREVKRGSVIYICGEGKNGIKRRLIAWEKHNSISLDEKPLFVSRVAAQFLSPESINDLVEAIDAAAAEAGEVALIIIDTLNRNMGAGDESSTKDMTMFVSAVDLVKDRYQATALVVHHTGHGNKERARGSMSLLGALDAEYRVEKASDTIITVTNTKMKDAASPPPIAFDMVQVEVGRDRMGQAVTSAVLRETDAPAKAPARLRGQALIAVQALGDALAAHGQIKTGGDFPSNRQCVTLDQWRDACDRHGLTDGESTSAARQAFGRAWKSLQEKGVIRVLDGHAWRCSDA